MASPIGLLLAMTADLGEPPPPGSGSPLGLLLSLTTAAGEPPGNGSPIGLLLSLTASEDNPQIVPLYASAVCKVSAVFGRVVRPVGLLISITGTVNPFNISGSSGTNIVGSTD